MVVTLLWKTKAKMKEEKRRNKYTCFWNREKIKLKYQKIFIQYSPVNFPILKLLRMITELNVNLRHRKLRGWLSGMDIEYANWYSNLFLTCNYLLSSAYKGKITLKIFVRIFLIAKAPITQRWIKHGKQWVYYYCCFWDKVPLHCSDCSGTRYVNEAGGALPASASGVLRLRLCTTTARSENPDTATDVMMASRLYLLELITPKGTILNPLRSTLGI